MKYSQIIAVYIFGSYVKEKMTPLSDIDLALVTETNEDKGKEILDFEFVIESEIIRHLPEYRFDVRTLNCAPILIQGKIITEGKLLLTKDQQKLSEFEEYILPRYFDFKIDYDFLLNNQYQAHLNGR